MTTAVRSQDGRGAKGAGKGAYHHGDLHNALTDAAVELAASGGPQAVVLREAARRVGVSAAAAYRHFDSHADLLRAVKQRSQRALDEAIVTALAAQEPLPDEGDDAVRRLRAIARGYVTFALAEPGLFRSCFCHTHGDATAESVREYDTFRLLHEVLDTLVAAGRLSPELREGGETAAWATVHGLATLLLDGPLSALRREHRPAVIERTLDAVVNGLRLE
ncbi:TetR/AcrR family transcriptional regulator [Streptomyces sp. 6N223]|uniref:TetR/AcrR family transcriptional regulator n=1 Tax=Streptomyces sp. 6N223 TaxID=3457412 RepID=UPI003FD2475E